ncbi:oligoendopeptidase F [Fructilactobacillus lindneri]|uniref:Oligopeptidase F n=2 Tax=Fructilactobacillus lindneri TaxID=53444 RepID=A0A0R2JW20_9LACO|nr:oligoendopeptidase F [Fructilactobacillus lindneri]ANZ57992.1 oligoendopeptidase F [Fructilactobacillus lindneri]ANZ59262.1 oligoendopeptidase F [Fructilactobacillus lindneri]KRN78381.1 Group B oligopeptidase pepB [Fructilactobacillus lindneri DSM 20690 = JCM 11027]POG98901.1 oligoendopeptidase F [Fructilactobacillus lindneri]POH00158.1 oligoendopeptidase F [Fructilactobacillus lindneri]
MSIENIPNRKDVPKNLTWDLTTIFKNHAEFEKEFKQVSAMLPQVSNLTGKLKMDSKSLLYVVQTVLRLNRMFEKLYVYAQLSNDIDTSNGSTQTDMDKVETLGTKVNKAQSWFDFEIIELGRQKIAQFIEEQPQLKQYERLFAVILKNEGHVLKPDEEKLLSGAANIFASPEKIFGILDSSDFSFPTVPNEDGKIVKLSNGIYSSLLQSSDREVRKTAFQKFYTVFDQFQHTLAATLSTEVSVNNYQAEVHHFDSAREMAMHENEIPTTVYDTLIKSVNQHLPLLHRYVALRKKILNLSEMHMYDMYVPLAQVPKTNFTFNKGKQIVLDALETMGDDYLKHVQEEFDNRWIDVVENQGKRTGAYSSGMYDTNPYVLLNWQDNLDNIYTLIHETGHSMHSYYSSHNQPYQYGDYSIFVAEIASTTNENILTDYLLENTADPEIKKYILSSYLEGFKGTIFRQTQFAEFENEIHQASQAGKALTADFMNEKYLKLNQKYYGNQIISDPEIKLEWSRIPHFYYDFYVYQYATGFAAASNLATNLTSGNERDLQNYLDYLKSGSSKTPIEIMQLAGVDMMDSSYLDNAFAKFANRLDQLEDLL